MGKNICLLGSTGSIGTQSLEVCENMGYSLTAITANTNVKLLEQQARKFNPRYVVISDESKYSTLKNALADTNCTVKCGKESICEVASLKENDIVINAIVGMIGIEPTLAAIENRTDIALANKETLVVGGQLIMQKAKEYGVTIFPVDSEHSAIFQCLQGNKHNEIEKIILTASGGPFFGKTKEQLKQVSVEQALKHPNWSMGSKITIDSATLMNKGLELIEAVWLFNKKPSEIEIIVHRESIIHSAVEFADGAIIAQLGTADMKLPIQYALTYPNRFPIATTKKFSFTDMQKFTFYKPDHTTFICLSAAIAAIEKGGLYPCIINGANEVAVSLFLNGKISFTEIGEIVNSALKSIKLEKLDYTLKDIIACDAQAREFVKMKF